MALLPSDVWATAVARAARVVPMLDQPEAYAEQIRTELSAMGWVQTAEGDVRSWVHSPQLERVGTLVTAIVHGGYAPDLRGDKGKAS